MLLLFAQGLLLPLALLLRGVIRGVAEVFKITWLISGTLPVTAGEDHILTFFFSGDFLGGVCQLMSELILIECALGCLAVVL